MATRRKTTKKRPAPSRSGRFRFRDDRGRFVSRETYLRLEREKKREAQKAKTARKYKGAMSVANEVVRRLANVYADGGIEKPIGVWVDRPNSATSLIEFDETLLQTSGIDRPVPPDFDDILGPRGGRWRVGVRVHVTGGPEVDEGWISIGNYTDDPNQLQSSIDDGLSSMSRPSLPDGSYIDAFDSRVDAVDPGEKLNRLLG